MKNLTPILLAGGIGKRLWPLSRSTFPKQFNEFFDKRSLFQNTIDRISTSKLISFNNPITITNSNHRFLVKDQFRSLKKGYGEIFLEPSSKNTAPAILAATLFQHNIDQNSSLLMLPTDHVIPNKLAFHEMIIRGYKDIENGNLIIFGIKPTEPNPGYGYINVKIKKNFVAYPINEFIEKPSLKRATNMLHEGNYLWNSGIILFKSKDLIRTFKELQPDIFKEVSFSLKKGQRDLDFFRLNKLYWNKCKDISIDNAILEKIKNVKVIPFSHKWSDLGDWNSVWKETKKSNNNIAKTKNVTVKDSENVIINNYNDESHLVGLGLKNIIAISTKDAVLVANKDKSQEIKNIVDSLEKKKVSSFFSHFKDFRPWGWFEILSESLFYKVKKIVVYPKSSLSLQSHKFRSEHWIIVEGTAKITINKEIKISHKGESVYIPIGVIHRLENVKSKPLVIIEIQTGTYLEEDDIVRYEDNYGRLK